MYQSGVSGQTAIIKRVPALWGYRRSRVLLCPLAFAAGSALWLTARTDPDVLIVLCAGLICLWLRGRLEGDLARTALAVALSGIAGVLFTSVRAAAVTTPRLTAATPITNLSGRVIAIEAGRTSVRLQIAPNRIDRNDDEPLPRRIRLTHKSALEVRPGDDVRCRGRLYPPPQPAIPGEYDFGRHAWFSGVGAVGYALGPCKRVRVQSKRGWLTRLSAWRDSMRRDVAEYVYAHTGRAGGMAAAMISGDRSLVPPSDVEALRISGLGHLLAISGLHMGLVIGVVFFGVRRLWPLFEPLAQRIPTPKAAALIALAAATWYLLLSGGSVSTQRAWVMGAVALGAKLADRSALSLVSVANAMWIVMLLRPESVLTPGFQMSFAATAALIALYENWPHRRRAASARVVMWSMSLLACSIVTFAATTPFALYHFGRAAPLSVIANLLAMPVISFVTAPSAIMAGIASAAGIAHWPLAVTGASLEVVLDIADNVASHDPGMSLPPMPEPALLLFIASLAVGVVVAGIWRLISFVPLIAGVAVWVLWAQPVAHVSSSGNIYVRSVDNIWYLWRLDDRREQGLRPLAVRGTVIRAGCRRGACEQDTPGGRLVLGADGILRFRSVGDGVHLDTALAQQRGGASILSGIVGDRVRYRLTKKGVPRQWQSFPSGAGTAGTY